MNTNEIKRTGEQMKLQCITHLHGIGCNVSVPWMQNTSYDFIVDANTKLYKVKCKTPVRITENLYSMMMGPRYTKNDADFVCTMIDGRCYLVPYTGQRTICLQDNAPERDNYIGYFIAEEQLRDAFLEGKPEPMERKPRVSTIVCVEDNLSFKGATKAAKHYQVHRATIVNSMQGNHGYVQKLNKTFVEMNELTAEKKSNNEKATENKTTSARPKQKVTNWPSKEMLLEKIQTMPMASIAKDYNVSGQTVAYWTKKYGIYQHRMLPHK